MPHSGSAFRTSSKTFCDARYQNECWYSIAWSKSFCASGLHDVSKCTLPSFPSSTCAKAGCANEINVAPANATIAVFKILIITSLPMFVTARFATRRISGQSVLLRQSVKPLNVDLHGDNDIAYVAA